MTSQHMTACCCGQRLSYAICTCQVLSTGATAVEQCKGLWRLLRQVFITQLNSVAWLLSDRLTHSWSDRSDCPECFLKRRGCSGIFGCGSSLVLPANDILFIVEAGVKVPSRPRRTRHTWGQDPAVKRLGRQRHGRTIQRLALKDHAIDGHERVLVTVHGRAAAATTTAGQCLLQVVDLWELAVPLRRRGHARWLRKLCRQECNPSRSRRRGIYICR